MSEWAAILWGFMKFKISILTNKKVLFLKEMKCTMYHVPCTMDNSYFSQKMASWRPNFPHPQLWYKQYDSSAFLAKIQSKEAVFLLGERNFCGCLDYFCWPQQKCANKCKWVWEQAPGKRPQSCYKKAKDCLQGCWGRRLPLDKTPKVIYHLEKSGKFVAFI